MDGRGRLAQSLTWIAGLWPRAAAARASQRKPVDLLEASFENPVRPPLLARLYRGTWAAIVKAYVPRGFGIAGSAVVILASASYGVIAGGHLPVVIDAFKEARDAAANAAGFRIVSLALAGQRHITREEVLATAGITGNTSLLFLDVADVRARLRTNPWVADATVLKLYPGELQIHIKERDAFALWQKDGRISVIADDGTIVEPFAAPQLLRLPLVVGAGAERRAKAFLTLLERYPDIESKVRACILVGGRRWNLRMKNGLDVRLPETDAAIALDRLVALDRDQKLLSRDILSVDLRLVDRVTVRLSDRAAKLRLDDAKDKKSNKGGKA
jgi:cell division protein FtsQ